MAGMGRFGAGVYTQEPSVVSSRVGGQARTQSALSGVDYYSTDVTQFLSRWPSDGPFRGMYEAWGARNILLNLPLIIPDVFLDEPWTRQLLIFKSELEPYLYSLAHETAINGDPLIAPVLYAFPDDKAARSRSTEFMMGPYLMIAAETGGPGGVSMDSETVSVYIPKGRWHDYFAGETFVQEHGSEKKRPGKVSGYQSPPVLLKEGAIVPSRKAGTDSLEALTVRVFPGPGHSSFTLYEDDGETEAWTRGALMTTLLELDGGVVRDEADEPPVSFTVRARDGSLPGTPDRRRFILEFLGVGNPGTATLDGNLYDRTATADELDLKEAGWTSRGTGTLIFKTPPLDLSEDHTVVIR
jgi:alpha-glucosidase